MSYNKTQLVKEYIKRQEKKKRVQDFDLQTLLSPKQLELVLHPSRYKVACTSRRAGKSTACAFYLIHKGLSTESTNCLYLSKTRGQAKRNLWAELCRIVKFFKLYTHINSQELTITLQNGTIIHLAGASNREEIEKYRGIALACVVIDEAQSYHSILFELVNEILDPALTDHQGDMVITGTPNASCAGMFYNAFFDAPPMKGFKSFHWTIHDNPFLQQKSGKTPDQILADIRERRGIEATDASYQREWLGKWIRSVDALVYRFDPTKNTYGELPNDFDTDWRYVIGVDLGYDDHDAIVVWAFSDDYPELFLVHEWKASKQLISTLAQKLKAMHKQYNPVKIVCDTGGLGKKIVEEIQARYHLTLHPAQKTEKMSYIELMNADMSNGLIKVLPNAKIIEEWNMLQKSEDGKEDPGFDNHLCDAGLYGFRESLHWHVKHRKKKIIPGSQEYWDEIENNLLQSCEEELHQDIMEEKWYNYNVDDLELPDY